MDFLNLIAQYRSPILTTIFEGFTLIGGEAVMILLICILYWCANRELAYRAGLAFFISGALVQILKLSFRIERPWVLDPEFTAVESAIAGATGYSFPSGHTQSATAFYLTLTLYAKKKRFRALFLVIMFGIAASRIYLGVHTPLDVAAAMLTSALTVIITFFVMRRHDDALLTGRNGRNFDLGVSAVIAVISLISLLTAIILTQKGFVDYANASDCAKTAGAGVGFASGWYFERVYVKFDMRTEKRVMQLVKLVIGVAATLLIKSGLKALFALVDESLMLDALRYLITVSFAIGLYPIIIKKYFNKGTNSYEQT